MSSSRTSAEDLRRASPPERPAPPPSHFLSPPSSAHPSSAPADTATDVVRWAAFSCVLVPVVLLWYGTSLAGTTGTALGLAAVTAVCRVLLRRSERCAAAAAVAHDHPPHDHPPRSHRHRHAGSGPGGRRGRRHPEETGGSD
ncbi:hypothetical protein ACIQAC_24775 [Streptomyces sp. NPDC088387]|uniref:hypothetical protein n=1 Tax=Streptomyces sp. NPDC088387 TaxID=3365859 RepID=UPI003803FC49